MAGLTLSQPVFGQFTRNANFLVAEKPCFVHQALYTRRVRGLQPGSEDPGHGPPRTLAVPGNSNDPLDTSGGPNSVTTKTFYQLIRTNATATDLDDSVFNPTGVSYNPATGKASLTFNPSDINTAGIYRLHKLESRLHLMEDFSAEAVVAGLEGPS